MHVLQTVNQTLAGITTELIYDTVTAMTIMSSMKGSNVSVIANTSGADGG